LHQVIIKQEKNNLRKIAIFTEGQTERILVRESLLRIFDLSTISFECYELISKEYKVVKYRYPAVDNPKANIFFLIVDAHGDGGVLTAIKDREINLVERGKFDTIIGLRDLYCDVYQKLSRGKINQKISDQLIQGHVSVINQLTYHDKIKIHYGIMEVEAWIIAMENLFQKINPVLTPEFIKQKLGLDLKRIDPQTTFYKPSDMLDSILCLVGKDYKKKEHELESICAKFDISDFNGVIGQNKCHAFWDFYKTIISC
jgi:hypothetical protein